MKGKIEAVANIIVIVFAVVGGVSFSEGSLVYSCSRIESG